MSLTDKINNVNTTVEGLYRSLSDFDLPRKLRSDINNVINGLEEEIAHWKEVQYEANGE